MITYFNRFHIHLTAKDAKRADHAGRCDEDAAALAEKPYVRRQLDKIPAAYIAMELRQYGAWNSEELQDTTKNRMLIIWIAAGNIAESL